MCRFAHKHTDLLTFTTKGETGFTTGGFDNYKKAIEKFKCHAKSDSHLEAMIKWNSRGDPSI